MQLPGRLRVTTLGDLLGALARAEASGTLELHEDRGRTHRVHLAGGRLLSVELDGATPSLGEVLRKEDAVDDLTLKRSLLRAMASRRLHGEVLVREFRVDAGVVDRALHKQMLGRLGVLERLADAQVTFRVAVRPPRGALLDSPLASREFLSGRRRARDAHASTGQGRVGAPFDRTARTTRSGRPATPDARASAMLGVAVDASKDDVRRAYRELVRRFHPDLHPRATPAERKILEARLAEVSDAYRVLAG
ncbi:MAG: J domain-containing protein [Polyangiaceae bacterium]